MTIGKHFAYTINPLYPYWISSHSFFDYAPSISTHNGYISCDGKLNIGSSLFFKKIL